MRDDLYIVRIKTPARALPYYYVRERGRGGQDILPLGHYRSPERAYAEALRDYLRAAARLQLFEHVLPQIAGRAAQRG